LSEIDYVSKHCLKDSIESKKSQIHRRTASLRLGAVALSLLLLLPVAYATTIDLTVTTFTSPYPQTGGLFGASVAVSGTRLIVGAPTETVAGLPLAGHVYIFSNTGSLVATLASPNPQTAGGFGWSVAVSGNSLVVGAIGEAAGGFAGAGHIYVFDDAGSLMTTLTSPNPQAGGDFGLSVAVRGNNVVVGSPGEAAGGFAAAGHVYVFDDAGSLMTTLTSPNPQTAGDFGFGAAVSGDIVIVGSPGEAAGGFARAGHAYVFSNTGSLDANLASPNSQNGGFFGASVAVSGKSVVVGAFGEAVGGFARAGHAYTFSNTGSLIATLTSPIPQTDGLFGNSVAVMGVSVLAGAPQETARGVDFGGQAYIFSNRGPFVATLTSPNSRVGGFFGGSVAVSGNSVVAGASGEASGGFAGAGHAYLFALSAASTTPT